MTDYQFSSIIEMIDILLEGCSDITEARKKYLMSILTETEIWAQIHSLQILICKGDLWKLQK